MSEKTVIDRLENWKGGRANGYYEPFKDEIHVLNGQDSVFRALIHEKVHRRRRNKWTFKIATITQMPFMFWVLFTIMMFLSAYTVALHTVTSTIPLFTIGITFLFCLMCGHYEEYKANSAMMKSCRIIKQNGSE